jgi:ABC-type transport system involved in cytochrome bd biosynthesis fused ATPase/permease subunit
MSDIIEISPYVFVVWLVGAALAWMSNIAIFHYTLGFLFVLVIGGYCLIHWLQTIDEKNSAARQKAQDEERAMVKAMTKDQRRAYSAKKKQEREQQQRIDEHNRQEEIIRNHRRQLALEERQQALAEKRATKIPLAVKIAASGYIGYKVGKKIGKW